MNAFAVAIFLQVMHQTVAANGRSDETTVAGTVGENIILPCWNTETNVTPSFTRWMKNGQFTIELNHSIVIPISSSEGHLTILYNQSLYINGINLSDEGTYLCDSLPHDNKTQTSLTLQIVRVPRCHSTAPACPTPHRTCPGGFRVWRPVTTLWRWAVGHGWTSG